jgi:phosphonate transport system substrate-binding protein
MSHRSLRRREALKGLGAFAGAILAQRAPAAQTELAFGLTPVFLTHDLDLLSALQHYLEKWTAHPVRLVHRRTYQEITALLLAGQLHAAWICGAPFVRHRDRLSLIAVPVWHGDPLYQSYIITAPDCAADSISQLEGTIHALSDPDSNSGYLVTCDLLARLGRRPETFFSRTFFTYGHRNVVRAVGAGLAKSGSVDGYVWEVLAQLEPRLTEPTKVIRRSEWLGFPPVAALSETVNTPDVQLLKSALLKMHEDDTGRRVLETLRLDRFSDENAAVFDSIQAKVDFVRRFG